MVDIDVSNAVGGERGAEVGLKDVEGSNGDFLLILEGYRITVGVIQVQGRRRRRFRRFSHRGRGRRRYIRLLQYGKSSLPLLLLLNG